MKRIGLIFLTKMVTNLGITLVFVLALTSVARASLQISYGNYAAKQFDIKQDKAWGFYVAPILLSLEKLIPDFASELNASIAERSWFYTSRRPISCPDQFAYEVKKNIVLCSDTYSFQVHKKWFAGLALDERARLILYHLVQGIYATKRPDSNRLAQKRESFNILSRLLMTLASMTNSATAQDIQKGLKENLFGSYMTSQEKKSADADYQETKTKLFEKFCASGTTYSGQNMGTHTELMVALVRAQSDLLEKGMSATMRGNNALKDYYSEHAHKLQPVGLSENENRVCEMLRPDNTETSSANQ